MSTLLSRICPDFRLEYKEHSQFDLFDIAFIRLGVKMYPCDKRALLMAQMSCVGRS